MTYTHLSDQITEISFGISFQFLSGKRAKVEPRFVWKPIKILFGVFDDVTVW